MNCKETLLKANELGISPVLLMIAHELYSDCNRHLIELSDTEFENACTMIGTAYLSVAKSNISYIASILVDHLRKYGKDIIINLKQQELNEEVRKMFE